MPEIRLSGSFTALPLKMYTRGSYIPLGSLLLLSKPKIVRPCIYYRDTEILWLFTMFFGLKIIFLLKSNYTKLINIDLACDISQQKLLNIKYVTITFRKWI